MFSFYSLESSVIGNEHHKTVRAAYLFYYATEAAFASNDENKTELKKRLNELVHDLLIIAKRVSLNHVPFPLSSILSSSRSYRHATRKISR